jgi:RimJ/RimL family protein N-acetyltransferase
MKLGQVVKTFTSKKGHKVVIRYIKREDLDDLTDYANNLIREDTYVGLSGDLVTREHELKYLEDSIKKIEKGEKIHLVVEVNGAFVGVSEIRRYDRRSQHVGEIGISIGKQFREEGIGTLFLQTLIDEGKKLGLSLLVLNCFECNSLAIHVYEKLGFKKAGIIPEMYKYKNKFVGEIKMYLPLTKGAS